MMPNRVVRLFLFLIFSTTLAHAQDRFYHVYVDNDSDVATGCVVNFPAFTSSIDGIDTRLTITTNSALPPAITSTTVHNCSGAAFDAGTNTTMAALGLNNGVNGSDVFEAMLPTTALSMNQSDAATLYFATDSTTATDIVLTNSAGGPIVLGFATQVPALGLLSVVFLLAAFLLLTRRHLSRKITVTIVLVGFVTTAWAMTIMIDGQTTDWQSIAPANTDPINDTSAAGSFADLTAVFATRQGDDFFVRMDVVDVENQAPIADPNNATTLEDNAVVITVTGSDAEGSPLTFSANAPANGSLSAFTVINATSSSATYTPNADFNGVDSFGLIANDGQVSSAAATVTINVTAVNDEPSFTSGGNVNQLKTAGAYSQIWATNISAGPANEAGQNLTFNITGNDNMAIFSAQPAIDAAGTLTFTGVPDATGTANIMVELVDDGGTANGGDDTSATVNFSITLQGVNDEPSFTAGADQTVNEDAGPQNVAAWATAISAGPADEAGQILTFNITGNTNAALFSAGPAVAANGDLTYTPAADANGTAMITLELMDDGGTANGGDDTSPSQSFSITVNAVNDAPSFTAGANQNVLEGAGAQTVNGWATAISPGPADEAAQTVSFTVVNDNNALFSVQPDVDTAGNLTYTPAAAALGTANVTVTAVDTGGTANGGVDTSAGQNFTISITAVNDEPSFTAGPDQTVNEDAGAQSVAAWATGISAGPPDEAGQNLTFNITGNTNAALFAAGPAVAANGTLTYTPAADANGSAMITLELMDDGGTANGGDDTSPPQSFTITVNAVNDAPAFTAGADQSVLEESGAQTVNGWATGISPGPADEAAQTVSFNVTNNNNALFAAQPAVDASGNLTYTPVANTSGAATVSVTAMDNGGTANGGVDVSAAQNFTITVLAVNDEPSFTAGADQTVNEDAGAQNVAGWATAISAGPADEAGQTLTFNITGNTNAALFSAGPAVAANGDLTYTPAANANGSATITLELMDNGGTANGGDDTSPSQSFVINVTAVNDPPTVTPPVAILVTTNISISVPDGPGDLLAGATDVEGTTMTIQGTGTIATTQGGTVTANTTTGAFTYDPPAGFTGADTFNYQVCDSGTPLPAACSPMVMVTLNVSGNTVWFIDDTAAAGGDGTLQAPFNSLAAFNGSTSPSAGDFVYLATGSGTYSGAGITLANDQTLFGQGTTGAFDTVAGISAAPFSVARPTLGGTRPVITSTAVGINLASGNTIRGLNVGNTSGFGIRATAMGDLTAIEVSVTGNGGAIQVVTSGNFAGATFDVLEANSNTIPGIDITGATGTLNVTGPGAGITNSSALPAVRINGGSMFMTYPGGIANTAGRSIDITNNNGGTLSFNGLINDDGQGISLTNNLGTFINFANLDLDTTTNAGFTATGGGTVNVTGATNTIDTTTGVAVNIQNTTLGPSGITLLSVSKNGATPGIDINGAGTAGFFTVTGTGTTNGSGGTIQNNASNAVLVQNTNNINISNMNINNGTNEAAGCVADVSGVTGNCNGAIELNNVANINLNNITIDGNGDASDELGIYANTVTNFDMDGVTIQNVSDQLNEHGVYVVNLLGTGAQASRWQDLVVNNTVGDTAVLVTQSIGTAELIIDGASQFSNALETGFEARTTNAAANLTVTLGDASAVGVGETMLIENTNVGAQFIAENGTLIANVRNSTIQPGTGVGSIVRPGSGANGAMFVAITGQSAGTSGFVNLNTTGNNITQEDGGAGGTGRSANALGGSRNISGSVNNNTITSNDEFVDGFFSNFTGVGTLAINTVLIDNNNINMTGSGGNETISGVEYNASDSAGQLSMTVTNNTIFSAGDNGFSGGIVSLAGDTGGGDNNVLCTDLIGNSATLPNAPGAVDGDDYVFVSFTGTEIRLEHPSIVGAITEAQIDAHIIGNDTGTTTAADVNVFNVGSGFHTGVAACPQ